MLWWNGVSVWMHFIPSSNTQKHFLLCISFQALLETWSEGKWCMRLNCNFTPSSEPNSTHCTIFKNAKKWARGWQGGRGWGRAEDRGRVGKWCKLLWMMSLDYGGWGLGRWAAYFWIEGVNNFFVLFFNTNSWHKWSTKRSTPLQHRPCKVPDDFNQ